ncbi:la protein homolog [Rhipicephalus microplus]|uniref:la protein homolog n=1 Tax=Rhipicephalus microplus TaxID=6941 RepID=UPI003F6B14D7
MACQPAPIQECAGPNDEIREKIVKQLEYYFGDLNLSRDKFLREKIKSGFGWVDIDVLLTFKKLRSLTENKEDIADAILNSASSLLEVHKDGTLVRRCREHPLPTNSEEVWKKTDERTVFVKGFPLTISIDELLEFFGQFGQCIDVYMRRRKKKFIGSVFATFATKDEADAFLARDSVKFEEQKLMRAPKQTHHALRLLEDAKFEALAVCSKELKFVPGCLMRVTGIDKATKWKTLKEALTPYAEVAFVDYCRSEGEAVLRFVEKGSARAVLAKLEEQGERLSIDGQSVTANALEGGEEVEYWKKLAAIKQKLRGRRGRSRSKSVQSGKKRKIEKTSA